MYVIPKDSYEMLARSLLVRASDTYLACRALRSKEGIIEVWADKKDSPSAVLVRLKRDPRFVRGGMEIIVAAQSDTAAEKLLEHLDKKQATFTFQGMDLRSIISNWYDAGEDTGHYYYRICKGELRRRMAWPTVRLEAEHESIVRYSQNLGDLFTAYKRSCGSRSFAIFAVIQSSEVLSYCCIGEGLVWDVFTREDKRRLGLGQSVLSAAVQWGLEFNEVILYSMLKSNIASLALCKSVGFKHWFDMFRYSANPR